MNKQQEKKIVSLIESSLKKSADFVEALGNSTNPQVKELIVKHSERAHSMLAILRAFKGDFVDLNIMAE